MSHIVSIQTEVRDPEAVAAACRLGLPEPAKGTATLLVGMVTVLLVKLPGWIYPVVVDVTAGRIHYDNYNGARGPARGAGPILQAYALKKARGPS